MAEIYTTGSKVNKYRLGMDLGGTNIRIGARLEGGNLQFFQRALRCEILQGSDSAGNLAGYIQDYIHKNQLEDRVEAIAIGVPSTLSRDRNRILQTPNIEGMNNLQIVDILEQRLRIKVFLERDVNMLFLRDMEVLGLPMKGVNIGIYVGTGIGNAIFIERNPLVGKDGTAGELGHIPMGGDRKCGCGNAGCAECHGAGWRLVELQREYFPNTPIELLFTVHKEAEQLLQFVDSIARVSAVEINILNPETIIFGGGVIRMKDFPRNYLEACVRKYARKPYPSENLDIYYANDAVENGVRGALRYASMKIEESKLLKM